MVTINKTFISNLRRPQGKPVEYFDNAETGFGIRIGKKGQVKFLIDYTLLQYDPEKGIAKEKRFRKVFGSWHRDKTNAQINIFTADDARKHVRKMLELAAEDKDPFSKSTAIKTHIQTFGDLLLEFKKRHVAKSCAPHTQVGYYDQIDRLIIPALGHVTLHALTTSMIEAFHSELGEKKAHKKQKNRIIGGPYGANRVLMLMKCALNKAVVWGYIEKNPAIGIKHFKEPPRMRFLSEEEVARLLMTCDQLLSDKRDGHRYVDCIDAVKMALMTGCRKGELFKTKWENINLKKAPATWSKPHTTTKQYEWEHIPLAPECVELLKKRYAENMARDVPSEYVFPMRDDTSKHLLDLKHSWTTLRKRAN